MRLIRESSAYIGIVEYCYDEEYHRVCGTGNTNQDEKLAELVCRRVLGITTDPGKLDSTINTNSYDYQMQKPHM